jgi:hypothetical protein
MRLGPAPDPERHTEQHDPRYERIGPDPRDEQHDSEPSIPLMETPDPEVENSEQARRSDRGDQKGWV